MPKFPKTEAEIVALAEQMVAGYTEHAGDFPSVTVATLTTALNDYKGLRDAQEDVKSQVHIATAEKDEGLNNLIEMMKNDLKKSEVDCTKCPGEPYRNRMGTKTRPAAY